MSSKFTGIIEHLKLQDRPNFTQGEMAIIEVSMRTSAHAEETATALRELREIMEEKFGLESLSSKIDNLA